MIIRYCLVPTLTTVALGAMCWWGWVKSTSSDGMPFARAGAAGTVLLVVVTLWRLSNILASDRQALIKGFEDRMTRMGVRPTIGGPAAKSLDGRVSILHNRFERAVFALLAFDLAVATIIWGFGDLIKLHHESAVDLLSTLAKFGGA